MLSRLLYAKTKKLQKISKKMFRVNLRPGTELNDVRSEPGGGDNDPQRHIDFHATYSNKISAAAPIFQGPAKPTQLRRGFVAMNKFKIYSGRHHRFHNNFVCVTGL